MSIAIRTSLLLALTAAAFADGDGQWQGHASMNQARQETGRDRTPQADAAHGIDALEQ